MLITTRLVRLDLPKLIDINEFIEHKSLIDAKSDLQAVELWLKRFKNANTARVYSRDAMRFLLWLIFICGKHLQELVLNDINDFLEFLQNPGANWCMHNKKLKRYDARWRPFAKPLSKSAMRASISALQSLFAFLEDSGFINKNPMRLIKATNILGNICAQKYNVYQRMLENDEWEALQETLEELPTNTLDESKYKVKVLLLFSLLYILGLRIEEASSLIWSNFRCVDGKWWCFVVGKGDKLGTIPVNGHLLNTIYSFREIHGLSKDIESDNAFLFLNEKNKKVTSRTLYNYIKNLALKASRKFTDKAKQNKLKALSPHWLRHLSASHQDKRGTPLVMICENHRHASINTTQIYMHSEDSLRHSKMQEHRLDIEPLVIRPKKEVQFYLQISLTKGPLDKNAAIDAIQRAMEAKILTNATATILHKDSLGFKYRINQLLDIQTINNIEMLCKIWLFEVSINQGEL